MTVNPIELTSGQLEVLGQLFIDGPLWDGYVASKAARSELIALGLVFRYEGWQALTPLGLKMALAASVQNRGNQRWYRKQQTLSADGRPL